MEGDVEFEAFAELLRRASETPHLIGRLADRLHAALPGQVSVERSGRLRGKRVSSLAVDFGDDRLRMEIDGRRSRAVVDHVVRGVCIRSEELSVDAWIERLAELLATEAKRSTAIRIALEEALR